LGKEIEIGSGLTAQDRVVTTPPDGIAAGDQVQVAGSAGAAEAADAKRLPGRPPG
jgi:hypothetical protein